MISLTIPLRTVSEANRRDHWATKAKRVAHQRGIVGLALRPRLMRIPALLPADVTLTRIAPRVLDDDNLRSALKACRDSVATELHIDDRDPRVVWSYGQEKGKAAVRIEVRRRDACANVG